MDAPPTDTDARQAEPGAPPWHALDADEVLTELGTGPHGLAREEARRRLDLHGPNRLEEVPPPPWWATLLNQFRSPLIYILLGAVVFTVALDEHIDAAVIGAVLALNAAIGMVQERRAEASVRALMQLVSPHARVVREGREWDVDSADLVPGDIVLLESGLRVPADLRLLSTTAFLVDESLLTGESVAVTKTDDPLEEALVLADRANLAFTGTVVASGRARGVVVATGDDTELGAIAEHVRAAGEIASPLQDRMARFATVIGVAIGVACVLTFVTGLLVGEGVEDMFLVAVALAVAAIPEGLPVVLTIALALGVRRMAHRNAIVRRLPAVETLGSTTLVGSDKTGTLTENRMTVQELWSGGRTRSLTGEPADPRDVPTLEVPGLDAGSTELTLLAGVLANEADLLLAEEDGIEVQGDPTETALLVAAARVGYDPESCREAYEVVAEIPFESERRYSASIREAPTGEHVVFVKGAPERVLAMCEIIEGPDLTPEDVLEQAHAMAGRGLRVLAMAHRLLPHGHRHDHDHEPEGLVFLGLQGMLDPPRAEVREAIVGCQQAGLRVVMITGDHASTARAIASELGIVTGDDVTVLTGVDLDDLDDEELRERVREVAVYARVSPDHKLRVVRAAQARGDVVAVTGDGVNDAPALKHADIGIAMGRSGTDVAREAADMVLADDNFVSIYAAVEEGRVTFENVRKVSFFLLSAGAATILLIPTVMLLGWPLILLPAQLLWFNLVTNGLQDVALAFEPAEKDVLDRPPRPRAEPVISRLLWERTALAGVVMAVGALLLYDWERGRTESIEQARTVALTTLVVFMAFHVGNARSERRSVFRVNPLGNRFLFAAQAGALAVHLGALHWRPTQYVLRVEPIGLAAWARIVLVASSVLVVVELHKLLRGRVGPGDPGR
ncbi:MAG: HAD-IC family P-type ATPase [Acidimicrobiia bacterium]|nr:HAD-IC family P-type ATPase [Acidimicrobiia bacterium]